MSRTSSVIPYGIASVTLTSLLEIPGCNIETFEPVSKIRPFDMTYIHTKINEVPHSNAILNWAYQHLFGDSETGGVNFIHTSSFPEFHVSRLSSRLAAYGGFFPKNVGDLGFRPGPLFLCEYAFLASYLSRVGHSVVKCPTPSHS
jgi:hypothetical protein